MAAVNSAPGDPMVLPTLTQIRNWDTTHLQTAARQWASAGEYWEGTFDAAHRELLNPGGSEWDGKAAEAAQARTLADLFTVRGAADALDAAAKSARTGATELEFAKQQILDLVGRADEAGFDVRDDLSLASRCGFTEEEYPAKFAQGQAFSSEIRNWATQLAMLDTQVAASITVTATPLGELSFPETPTDAGPSRDVTVQAVDYKQGPTLSPTPEPGGGGADDSAQGGPESVDGMLLPAGPAADKPPGDPKQPKGPRTDADAPPSIADTIAGKHAGNGSEEAPNPGSPLDALVVAADPTIVDRQAAKVAAAEQKVVSAQAKADKPAGDMYMGSHEPVDALGITQELFDARADYTREREKLEALGNARAALSGQQVSLPPPPDGVETQAFPPQPPVIQKSVEAFYGGSKELAKDIWNATMPDVPNMYHVATDWDGATDAEKAKAATDAAGMVPLPGAKALGKGIEHGLDALGVVGRNVDDLPTAAIDDIADDAAGAGRHHGPPDSPDAPDPSPGEHHAGNGEAARFDVEDTSELLARSEGNGHLLERHVGLTTQDLSARLANDTRLTTASTFASNEEAASAVSTALQHNRQAIADWIAGGMNRKLEIDAPFSGGVVMRSGAAEQTVGTGVKVVLKSDGAGGWYVLTGFPTP